MSRVGNVELSDVTLEQGYNLTDGHTDLILQQVVLDLRDNHLYHCWPLINVADDVIDSAREDHSFPILQKFQSLLVHVVVLLELRKTLKISVLDLHILAVVDDIKRFLSRRSPNQLVEGLHACCRLELALLGVVAWREEVGAVRL